MTYEINPYLTGLGVQDPDDPTWASGEPIDMKGVHDDETMHARNEHGGMRTLHGLIDTLHNLVEDTDWVDRETDHGQGHRWPRKRDELNPIKVFPLASAKWKGVTYNIDAGPNAQKVAVQNPKRRRITFTNLGPGPVYLSSDTGNPAGQEINRITLQVCTATLWAPRVFECKDEIYAFPAVAGVGATVEAQDEWDE